MNVKQKFNFEPLIAPESVPFGHGIGPNQGFKVEVLPPLRREVKNKPAFRIKSKSLRNVGLKPIYDFVQAKDNI